MKDLSHLRVGDKVVLKYGFNQKRIKTVERTTKTQIIVNGDRFRKKDGLLVGGDIWNKTSITEATPEIIASMKLDEDLKYTKQCLYDNFKGLVDVYMKNKDLIALRALNNRLSDNDN